MIEKVAAVAFGGAVGAVLRFVSAAWVARLTGVGFAGTLFVNIAGSFAMGILVVLMMERFPGTFGRFGPLLITGVLGGFTTFSAFSLDALMLLERGRVGMAAAYVGASVLLSVAALYAGFQSARALVA